MPVNLASPGIKVREVDLTVGRIDPSSPGIGAIVGPFSKGPVNLPTLITSEQELIDVFGKPSTDNNLYEYWLTASSFLSYGGSLRVVRVASTSLKNAGISSVLINSVEHYEQLGYDDNTFNAKVVARQPGDYGNGLRVAFIDGKADQILSGISTTGTSTFTAAFTGIATVGVSTNILELTSTTGIQIGQVVKPIPEVGVGAGITVLAVNNSTKKVTIGVGTVGDNTFLTTNGAEDLVAAEIGAYASGGPAIQIGDGVSQPITSQVADENGNLVTLDGTLRGIVTEIGEGQIGVKVFSHVSAASTLTTVEYSERGTYRFADSGAVDIYDNTGTLRGTTDAATSADWFASQKLVVGTEVLNGVSTDKTVMWSTIASRPSTTAYAAARGSRHDEVHIAVIDSAGKITGNAGTILEIHQGLSKAKDAEFSVGSPSYWRKYLKNNSQYIFGGSVPGTTVETGFTTLNGFTKASGDWSSDAEGVIFEGLGASNHLLSEGVNYSTDATRAELIAGYDLFMNKEKYEVDFILMGGGCSLGIHESQAVAQKCIAVAAARQDAIAFISPHRTAFVDNLGSSTAKVKSDKDITKNILEFYGSLTTSSYAVFDSGYKYMYDRFANTFRYVPLNGDIAGLCARNDANNFPWFSPAGNSRGAILNAVKLAYNPDKSQRDQLYSNRINPVIQSPGAGIILFGDKTGLGKASAFDRINVRRLFIYLEDAISAAANDQLFEFNDEITRTNFVNIVEPFLRDVQSKRGIFDYVVICDETNNTGAVIDNNEFVADIYIKPARSINFIGLTFVATRTGVAFEEVIGNV